MTVGKSSYYDLDFIRYSNFSQDSGSGNLQIFTGPNKILLDQEYVRQPRFMLANHRVDKFLKGGK